MFRPKLRTKNQINTQPSLVLLGTDQPGRLDADIELLNRRMSMTYLQTELEDRLHDYCRRIMAQNPV